MQHSRRQFLKQLSVMAGAMAVPDFLVSRKAFAGAGEGEWKISGSHWGAIRAKVLNGRITEIKPFEYDKYPTEMINGIKGLIYGESRIRYPMVRLD